MKHLKDLKLCGRTILLAVWCALAAVACAPDTSGLNQTEQVQQQVLAAGFCDRHPAACEAVCGHQPQVCERLCERHPQIPFCQLDNGGEDAGSGDDGPSCGTDDSPCTEDEDCCGGFECIDNNGAGFICNEIQVDAGPQDPCTPITSQCDPNGLPCCVSDGLPGVCELSDPSDPDAFYTCNPAP